MNNEKIILALLVVVGQAKGILPTEGKKENTPEVKKTWGSRKKNLQKGLLLGKARSSSAHFL